jgi:hypothetical protein
MRAAILAFALAACTAGDPTQAPIYDAAPDAWVCDPLLSGITADGHHNPGQECLGCHDDNSADGAPRYTIAGTLYDGPSGNNPKVGATIIISDALDREFRMVTTLNGNFYMSAELAFPIRSKVSGCPKTKSMQGFSIGNCNQAGCHSAADAQGRVYLQLP